MSRVLVRVGKEPTGTFRGLYFRVRSCTVKYHLDDLSLYPVVTWISRLIFAVCVV